MPHKIGFVDNSGGVLAHYKMLAEIKALAESAGWQTLRYETGAADRELILKGKGYSGSEEIFVGVRTYQNADADYYNLLAGAFTGYVAGNSFDSQPGAALSGVPAHNQRIDYWLTVNAQRIALAMKVGTPVYESMYIGKMLPYGRPSQYPYPMVCAGMFNGAEPKRFSDVNQAIPYKGNRANMRLRAPNGWSTPHSYPYGNAIIAGRLRDTGGHYHLLPVELHDNSKNLWGALDGICYVSGFDNVVEDTAMVEGKTWVVMQDVWRTGHGDYYAMRMD